MESEYIALIALSQSMRDLIGIWEILKEIKQIVLMQESDKVLYRRVKKCEQSRQVEMTSDRISSPANVLTGRRSMNRTSVYVDL